MAVVKHQTDLVRTEELNVPELLVIEGIGDDDHFFCIPKRTFPQCPKCGCGEIRNQGNMHRDYLDIIPRNDDAAVITLSLEFRKNKCLSPGCGCVFYPSFSFASPYSRTTHRLENAVVRMILEDGYSYSDVDGSGNWKRIQRVSPDGSRGFRVMIRSSSGALSDGERSFVFSLQSLQSASYWNNVLNTSSYLA